MPSFLEIQPCTQTWHLNNGLGTEILKLFGKTVKCFNYVSLIQQLLCLTLKKTLTTINTWYRYIYCTKYCDRHYRWHAKVNQPSSMLWSISPHGEMYTVTLNWDSDITWINISQCPSSEVECDGSHHYQVWDALLIENDFLATSLK